jgi:hypothetical protein
MLPRGYVSITGYARGRLAAKFLSKRFNIHRARVGSGGCARVDRQIASQLECCQESLTDGERIARLPEQQSGNINENFSITV